MPSNFNCPCCRNENTSLGSVLLDNIKTPLNKVCTYCLDTIRSSVDDVERLASCITCGIIFHKRCSDQAISHNTILENDNITNISNSVNQRYELIDELTRMIDTRHNNNTDNIQVNSVAENLQNNNVIDGIGAIGGIRDIQVSNIINRINRANRPNRPNGPNGPNGPNRTNNNSILYVIIDQFDQEVLDENILAENDNNIIRNTLRNDEASRNVSNQANPNPPNPPNPPNQQASNTSTNTHNTHNRSNITNTPSRSNRELGRMENETISNSSTRRFSTSPNYRTTPLSTTPLSRTSSVSNLRYPYRNYQYSNNGSPLSHQRNLGPLNHNNPINYLANRRYENRFRPVLPNSNLIPSSDSITGSQLHGQRPHIPQRPQRPHIPVENLSSDQQSTLNTYSRIV